MKRDSSRCWRDFSLVRSMVVMEFIGQKWELGSRTPYSSEGVDDFAGSVGAGSACEAVAGMRAGAAEKKAADRSFVARPIENGTHGEELIESEFAVENVAAGEAVAGFQILGRDDLNAFDQAGKIRGVSSERFDDGVAQVVASRVPVPFP